MEVLAIGCHDQQADSGVIRQSGSHLRVGRLRKDRRIYAFLARNSEDLLERRATYLGPVGLDMTN